MGTSDLYSLPISFVLDVCVFNVYEWIIFAKQTHLTVSCKACSAIYNLNSALTCAGYEGQLLFRVKYYLRICILMRIKVLEKPSRVCSVNTFSLKGSALKTNFNFFNAMLVSKTRVPSIDNFINSYDYTDTCIYKYIQYVPKIKSWSNNIIKQH